MRVASIPLDRRRAFHSVTSKSRIKKYTQKGLKMSVPDAAKKPMEIKTAPKKRSGKKSASKSKKTKEAKNESEKAGQEDVPAEVGEPPKKKSKAEKKQKESDVEQPAAVAGADINPEPSVETEKPMSIRMRGERICFRIG